MEAETNQTKLEIPVALQVVAWLMILTGGYAALGMLFALAQGNLFLNFEFLYLFVGIGLLKFPSGKYGVAIVARSKGDGLITPDLAREGLARVWIDKTLYEFPFSGEDDSDGMVTSILEKALERHAESNKTSTSAP